MSIDDDIDLFIDPPAKHGPRKKLRRLTDPNEWRAGCRACGKPQSWRNLPMACACGGRRFWVQPNDALPK